MIAARPAAADAFLSWTVSPGTFANGVWTIPGTTDLTASVVDEFGNPITVGELVMQNCGGTWRDPIMHPAADCEGRGPVRWRDQFRLDLANPRPIDLCFCAGDQLGFRFAYRNLRSGFQSITGEPFDLLAESTCPARQTAVHRVMAWR